MKSRHRRPGRLREKAALVLVAGLLVGLQPASWAQTVRDTLFVAVGGDIETIDPPVTSGAPFQHEIISNLYDFLIDFGVKRTESGELIGDLNRFTGEIAKSFTVSADGRATFRLRESARFADGTPVTAEDVKYSYERIFGVNAVTAALMRMATVNDASHVRVVDGGTVEIRMARPNPLLFGNMAQFGHAIVNAAQVKAHSTPQDPWATGWMKTNAVGAGAFLLERWTPGSEIVLARNEHYWAGPARLRRIVFRIIPDPSTRALLLRRGAVDVAYDLALEDLEMLRNDPNVAVRRFPTTIVKYLGMNVNVRPFDNTKVRQAVAYAVPYDTILKEAVKGYGLPLRSPVPKGMASHDESVFMYGTNPTRAKALLAEAGLGSGFRTRLTVRAGFPVDEQIAVWVQSALRGIGVEVEIDKLPLAGYTERLRRHEFPGLFIHEWLSINNDPFYHYFWLFRQGCCNYGNWAHPEVTELIGAMMLNTNTTARNEASRRAQRIIMEEAPWAFLYQPDYTIAMRRHVKGYIYYPDRYNRWYSVHKE
jgi:peptide/nickel transport system substrate-binding protein